MLKVKTPTRTNIDTRVWFTCPHCECSNVVFNTSKPPEVCEECDAALPDYTGIKKSKFVRAAYHHRGYLQTWFVEDIVDGD